LSNHRHRPHHAAIMPDLFLIDDEDEALIKWRHRDGAQPLI
jgi:hypothetical protein